MPDEKLPPEVDDLADVEDAPGGEAGSRRLVTDTVRKALLAGVGALFMTEEGARRLARDWKLPKEVLGYVTSQAQGAKEEILRVVSDEVRKFFQSESLRREFVKLLGSMSIEVHAEIRLKDAGSRGAKVNVHRATVRAKGARKAAAPEPDPEDAEE